MTDSVQAQLEAVLRGIEERTPRKCDYRCRRASPINGISTSIHSRDCNDRHVAPVRAEQARAVERMVIAAAQTFHGATFDNQMAWQDDENAPQQDAMAVAWAAALRAGEDQKET